MGRKRRKFLLASVVAGCLVAPGSASAAITFGADLTLTADQNFNSAALITNQDSAGVTNPGSPIDGVLVSARVRSLGAAATGYFRVLHPNLTPTEYKNVGQAAIALPSEATVGGVTLQQSTRIPIKQSDLLGFAYPGFSRTILHMDADAECAARVETADPATQQAVNADGVYRAGSTCGANFEVLVSGTVEPDGDGDGFGDESQDSCLGISGQQSGCPIVVAPVVTPPPVAAPVTTATKKKCKKGRKLKRGKCVKKKKK